MEGWDGDSSTTIYTSDDDSTTRTSNSSEDESSDTDTDDEDSHSAFSSDYGRNNHFDHLHIYYTNAQSLKNKIDVLTYETRNHDIICLTESWLDHTTENESLHIPGFQMIERKDRETDRFGGVACYVRDTLAYTRRDDLERPDLELMWLNIAVQNKQFLLGVWYRHPNAKVNTWTNFREQIEEIKENNSTDIIIVGDCNNNLLDNKGSFNRLLQGLNMAQLVYAPTHHTATSDKAIDFVATTAPDYIREVTVTPPALSTHSGILVCLDIKIPTQEMFRRKVYLYEKADWEGLQEAIKQKDWEPLIGEDQPIDKAADNLTDELTSLIHKHVPHRNKKVWINEHAWVTAKIHYLAKKKSRKHKKATKTGLQRDWNAFRKAQTALTAAIKQAKKIETDDKLAKINECGPSQQKVWWSIAKEFYTRAHNTRQMNSPIITEGRTVVDSQLKATLFNQFFIKSGLSPQESQDEVPPPDDETTPDETMEDIEITVENLRIIMKNLPTQKAPGPDKISNIILARTADSLAPILCYFYNRSLREGHFPSRWKLAHVTPVHKGGNTMEMRNYRPISLLDNLGKLFERAVVKNIYNFLIRTNNISQHQYAYKENSSTTHQLTVLYDEILRALDSGKDVLLTFGDASKAFDKIWTAGLIAKLKQAGIKGNLLEWITTYLTKRRQATVIKGKTSPEEYINSGVPQGSILGPLFFIFYVNSLIDITQVPTHIYADDLLLFVTFDATHPETCKMNEALKKVQQWATTWKMVLNPTKTKCMMLSRKHKAQTPQIEMMNTPIALTDQHKYLGIHLQSNAKWATHIKETLITIHRRLDILAAQAKTLRRYNLERLYKSYIRPFFDLYSTIWMNCKVQEAAQLESAHARALRLVIGAKKGTAHNRLQEEMGERDLTTRRKYQALVFLFKIMFTGHPQYLHERIMEHTLTDERAKRDPTRLKPVKTTSDLHRNSFLPATIRNWNLLPKEIREVDSIKAFQTALTHHMLLPPPPNDSHKGYACTNPYMPDSACTTVT